MKNEHSMIDTSEALISLVERAGQNQSVALDTEFVWDRTYYPRLGVVQVGLSEEACFLVDPLAVEDLTPLGELIADPCVIKILHDAPQDLTILRRATGAYPRNVFDTRCAAGLAGLSSTTSLRELVGAVLGVDLAKTERRTNWLRRPLTAPQHAYAIEDVCYLPAVNQELLARVRSLVRETWLREELAVLDDPALYAEKDPRQQYHRVKGAGRVSPRELAILRELAAWREEEARHRDRPRGRILADATLLHLARRKPRSPTALRSFKGLARRYEEKILEGVHRGLAVADGECPRRPRRRIAGAETVEAQLKRAMVYLRKKSEAEDIDPPFVASRAEVKNLVCDGPDAPSERHRLLRGWRRGFVGEGLLQILADGRTVK